jgi:hypothetical protein
MDAGQGMSYWAGIDWGHDTHVVVVVDSNRRLQKEFEVHHTPEGFAELSAALRAFTALKGIAVESHRGPLMVYLLQQGFRVYPINPKVSHAWRKNDSVAACKSDGRDGRVLAQELAVRHERLTCLAPDGELTRKLAMLCEDEQDLIGARTSLIQSLQDTLKQYFPAALNFFTEWTSPAAWDWLKKYTTPKQFCSASESALYRFLKGHRIGLSPVWQERVQSRKKACDWPADAALTEAYAMRALQLVGRLKVLEGQITLYRKRIEALFETHPDQALFDSLPGAGKKLAPRLLSIFGTDRERYESSHAISQLSGAAPVTLQSGRKTIVRMRRACRKHWRNTLHLFARSSVKFCPWAKAYYAYRRSCGDKDALALRKLADKWMHIIYRMWQNRTTYDDALHMKSLQKTNSPLLRFMDVENRGDNLAEIA